MKIHKMFLTALMLALVAVLSAFAQTRVTPTSTINQSEPHIAVNPTDPINLIGTAITQLDGTPNQIAYYYSFDGGQTWSGNENIPGTISAGDPVVAFDGTGTYYCVVAFARMEERNLE
jgi:hypothetical protein